MSAAILMASDLETVRIELQLPLETATTTSFACASMTKRINIAIVGLGFGAEFIPIYQRHPLANMVAVCQRNETKLHQIADAFGVEKRYTSYEDLLADPQVDAVHINTPIPDHARQSIQALKAGKHVACTVPMATTVEECRQIVALSAETGLKYMMMETVVYSREFLFVEELYKSGGWARFSFCRPAISRIWTVGPVTGLACRRCTTPRTASAPAWRSPALMPSMFPASDPAGSARR